MQTLPPKARLACNLRHAFRSGDITQCGCDKRWISIFQCRLSVVRHILVWRWSAGSQGIVSVLAIFGFLKLSSEDLGIANVSVLGRLIFKEEDRIHEFLEILILHCPQLQGSVYKLRAMKL